jgi:hypothetical protein
MEREELTRWSRSRTLAARDVFVASLILALADGKSYTQIDDELNTSRPMIARWRARFEKDGMAGLETQHQIRSSRKKPLISSPYTWTRPMLLFSASMKRRRFRRWTDWMRCYRFRRAGRKSMDSNTTATERSHCMPALDVNWAGSWRDRTTSHQRGLSGFMTQIVERTPGSKQIHIVLDNLSPQDQRRDGVSGRESASAFPLHADLFLLSEPRRDLVRENPARCHRSRRLRLRR